MRACICLFVCVYMCVCVCVCVSVCAGCLELMEGSSQLSQESRKYAKDAKNLNMQLLYRQYGPPAVVAIVILLVLYIRIWWY